ncbi:MAG: putative TrmH family tRNA/rRNA methyltransferase, partial [Chlamydiae bacterium]|nr:putative TrmH family tRNA/rRNA methyltransferase [Chlamydiota bacterium]
MLTKEIKSLQHPIIKTFVKLRTMRKFRHEKKQVVLAGKKLVSEVKNLDLILVKKDFPHSFQAEEIYHVNDAILKKVTGLESPEPIAAIAPMPKWETLEKKNWILAFDQVSDPGNLGTLLRSALALGWEGAFLTPNCVDPYNEKALRAAKGATFHLPMQMGTEEDLQQLSESKNIWVADVEGSPLSEIQKPSNAILVLGNEALGISKTLKERFKHICIPIHQMQSLNVAAAGAILLYT